MEIVYTVPTYEVSGIAIAAVEAETEVDAQRELARRLDEAGVQIAEFIRIALQTKEVAFQYGLLSLKS